MDNKKIIRLIIVLLVICGILGGIILVVSSMDDKKILTEGNVNEVVAKVNGEEIKRFDINYKKYIEITASKSGELSNPKTDFDELKNTIIKEKVLLQEAKKNNIDIDEVEKQSIRDNYNSNFKDFDKMVAHKIGMSEEEYLNYLIEQQINEKVISKISKDIFDKITNGQINIDDEEFKKCYEEYANYKSEDLNEEVNKKMELAEKANEAYINYLIKSEDVEK